MGEHQKNTALSFTVCLGFSAKKNLNSQLREIIDKEVIRIGKCLLVNAEFLYEQDFTFYFQGQEPRFECDIALEAEQTTCLRAALKTIAAADLAHEIGSIIFHFHKVPAEVIEAMVQSKKFTTGFGQFCAN